MSRYAVGDIQGCFSALECLLERVDFDPQQDELWSVGDLVNRGPQSLATLRFFYQLGDAAKVVLGNHDLHLLAVYEGIATVKRGDTLQEILDAPDCAQLMQWLRQQPLLRIDPQQQFCIVHAGLPPQWSLDTALTLANEVSTQLRSDHYRDFLEQMYGNTPACWSNELQGMERLRVITNYLTRMRYCDAEGTLDLKNKGPLEETPEGFYPWFAAPNRQNRDIHIVFGHWAALMGNTDTARDNAQGLDTGCVWGEQMTLIDLDTRQQWQCSCG